MPEIKTHNKLWYRFEKKETPPPINLAKTRTMRESGKQECHTSSGEVWSGCCQKHVKLVSWKIRRWWKALCGGNDAVDCN